MAAGAASVYDTFNPSSEKKALKDAIDSLTKVINNTDKSCPIGSSRRDNKTQDLLSKWNESLSRMTADYTSMQSSFVSGGFNKLLCSVGVALVIKRQK